MNKELLNFCSQLSWTKETEDIYLNTLKKIELLNEYELTEGRKKFTLYKEAVNSCAIENIYTNIETIMRYKRGDIPFESMNDNSQLVANYVNALENLCHSLEENKPLTHAIILDSHKLLFPDTVLHAGKYREQLVRIGTHIPPDAQMIQPLMDLLIDFVNNDSSIESSESIFIPDLIKIAIMHGFFELVHPFIDGNGRFGRMLIYALLISKKIIKNPVNISYAFDYKRQLYYDCLDTYSLKNKYTLPPTEGIDKWVSYCLIAFELSIEQEIKSLDADKMTGRVFF